MKKCPRCGKEFEGNFCPECGYEWVDKYVCPKCGAEIDGNVKFCNHCGQPLVSAKASPKTVNILVNVVPAIIMLVSVLVLWIVYFLPIQKFMGQKLGGVFELLDSEGNYGDMTEFGTPLIVFAAVLTASAIGFFIFAVCNIKNEKYYGVSLAFIVMYFGEFVCGYIYNKVYNGIGGVESGVCGGSIAIYVSMGVAVLLHFWLSGCVIYMPLINEQVAEDMFYGDVKSKVATALRQCGIMLPVFGALILACCAFTLPLVTVEQTYAWDEYFSDNLNYKSYKSYIILDLCSYMVAGLSTIVIPSIAAIFTIDSSKYITKRKLPERKVYDFLWKHGQKFVLGAQLLCALFVYGLELLFHALKTNDVKSQGFELFELHKIYIIFIVAVMVVDIIVMCLAIYADKVVKDKKNKKESA